MTTDPHPYYFHCSRRDMLVAKDTSDCQGCPLRVYPTPCDQYKEYAARKKREAMGLT
jgi:hypothetical protein